MSAAALALLVYVIWNAVVAGLLSFASASIGTMPSSLALHVFALWGPLVLVTIIFLCLWLDYPEGQSNRLAWILVPHAGSAFGELLIAVLYLYIAPDAARAPLPTLVLAFFAITASYYAYGALSCVTRDAFHTVDMKVRLPRSTPLGTRRV